MAGALIGIEVDDWDSFTPDRDRQFLDREGLADRDAKRICPSVHLALKPVWIKIAITMEFDAQTGLAQRNSQSDRESPVLSRMPARLDDLLRAGLFSEMPKNHPNRDWSAISFELPERSRTLGVAGKLVAHCQTKTFSSACLEVCRLGK